MYAIAVTSPITAKIAVQSGSDASSATIFAVNHSHPERGLLRVDIEIGHVRIMDARLALPTCPDQNDDQEHECQIESDFLFPAHAPPAARQ